MADTAPSPVLADTVPNDDARRQLLLADLQYWSESFWKSEMAGENRVKFYITLVTAVGAGLGALYLEGVAPKTFQQIAFVAVTGVLAIGLVTFARMVRRNQVSDEYKAKADAIRTHLLGKDLLEEIYGLQRNTPRGVLNGGLTTMMLVMNCMVAAALSGLGFWAVSSQRPATAWLAGVAGAVVVGRAQRLFHRWRDKIGTT